MLFKKEFLLEIGIDRNIEVIEEEITNQSRWSTHYRVVFKWEGKFYETHFSRGSTECQDESPYEYEDDDIECPEVEPYEVTVTKYRVKK